MNRYVKILLFGFLAWLLPFAFSFLFYSKEGKPLIDILFFKAIIVTFGALTGIFLLALYFRKVSKDFLSEGIVIGISWLLINLALDAAILIPMSKMSLYTYFTQIGLTYLSIPIMSIGVGYMLERRKK